MKHILTQAAMGITLGWLLAFVIINVVMGCEDWDQPNCVGPIEMFTK